MLTFTAIVLLVVYLVSKAVKTVFNRSMNSLEEWAFNVFDVKAKIKKTIESARNRADSINQ
jgi:hypothetical protein